MKRGRSSPSARIGTAGPFISTSSSHAGCPPQKRFRFGCRCTTLYKKPPRGTYFRARFCGHRILTAKENAMSYYGAHWRIDGVTAAFIMRGDRNGRYRIVFERESAELPQIESINWAQPSVERLTEAGEFGLPEGYGFELVKITYDSAVKSYTVEVKTARN